ncbi:MAG: hypothetical protein KME17_22555 [Cyanosarcina radialis HA8281-LM2]|jgi:hypothetical protein|nr:hypothetical protein [Cyanosarcina radialis HA8281-LM2]
MKDHQPSHQQPKLPSIASPKRTTTKAKILQFPLNRRLTATQIGQRLARLAAELEAANRELTAIALAVPGDRRIVGASDRLQESIELYLTAIAPAVKQKPARSVTQNPNRSRAKMLTISKLVNYLKRAVLRSLGV